MRPLLISIVAVVILAFGVPASATAAPSANGNESAAGPEIVELYPDPVAHGDTGEFLTVRVPDNLSQYSLADDQVNVSLRSDRPTAAGRITFSTAPNTTRNLTDRTVVPVSDRLRLSNDGETVRLLRQGTVVDTVRYGRTKEGELYHPDSGEWTPLAATDRPVVTAEGGSVEAFVLPDSPDRAVEFLESSQDRIYLSGYTLTSQRIVDALIEAADRNVPVEVLVDGSPVGGMSTEMATALDELSEAGIDVRVLGGDRARYRFHHAKYAVVDDRALVTTENWKPAGLGGQSSRGWAVITDQQPIVSGLVETFRADVGWVDSLSWQAYDDRSIVDDEPATDSYPSKFEPSSLAVERTELLVTPDNAEARILDVIDNANESIAIKQVRIGDRGLPFLQAVLDAARQGVEVRILLGSSWYAEEENRKIKRWLDEQAAAEDLPLEVRLAEPGGDFEKIHAKGMIVDKKQVIVGSINWNNNSVRSNREVALLMEGEQPATYFKTVFDADWEQDTGRELPAGLALVCLFVAVVAILAASRLSFEDAS